MDWNWMERSRTMHPLQAVLMTVLMTVAMHPLQAVLMTVVSFLQILDEQVTRTPNLNFRC